jgi:hypothetical protein
MVNRTPNLWVGQDSLLKHPNHEPGFKTAFRWAKAPVQQGAGVGKRRKVAGKTKLSQAMGCFFQLGENRIFVLTGIFNSFWNFSIAA